MRGTLLPLVLLAVCLPIAASAQPLGSLSWGSCTPRVADAAFTGPGLYELFITMRNLDPADPVMGSELAFWIGPGVPDAWRFDDAGCQTTSGLSYNQGPAPAECPYLRGPNATNYVDVEYVTNVHKLTDPRTYPRLRLHLISAHDAFTPAAGVTYTLWHLVFDHRYSAAAEDDSDPATCDGAGRALCVYIDPTSDPVTLFSYLITRRYPYDFIYYYPDGNQVTWNHETGCPGAVPALPTTWGRLKTLYRE